MAHWARINEKNVVEEVIVTENNEDDGESWILENLHGTWLKGSYNTRANKHLLGGVPFRKNAPVIGSTYSYEIDGFIPPKEEWESEFILDSETGTWVPPIPFPEDADWVLRYGPRPELVEQEVTNQDGEPVSIMVPNIAQDAKVYFWIRSENAWGMNPNSNYPKPEGDFFWHPIEKEWQAPAIEKPGENYYWNVFENQWLEIPAPPTE